MYSIEISSAALEDLKKIQKSGNKKVIDKVNQLILEIALNPREGTGKPEMLKNLVGEVWSRRINQKDRLVYEIFETSEQSVVVLQMLGHYKDK
jgi:toxin YoeB